MENVVIISKKEIEEIKNTQFLILQLIKNIKLDTPDDELVTVKQASQITKISEQKLREMIEQGKLESNRKYGRAKRIYRRSL